MVNRVFLPGLVAALLNNVSFSRPTPRDHNAVLPVLVKRIFGPPLAVGIDVAEVGSDKTVYYDYDEDAGYRVYDTDPMEVS